MQGGFTPISSGSSPLSAQSIGVFRPIGHSPSPPVSGEANPQDSSATGQHKPLSFSFVALSSQPQSKNTSPVQPCDEGLLGDVPQGTQVASEGARFAAGKRERTEAKTDRQLFAPFLTRKAHSEHESKLWETQRNVLLGIKEAMKAFEGLAATTTDGYIRNAMENVVMALECHPSYLVVGRKLVKSDKKVMLVPKAVDLLEELQVLARTQRRVQDRLFSELVDFRERFAVSGGFGISLFLISTQYQRVFFPTEKQIKQGLRTPLKPSTMCTYTRQLLGIMHHQGEQLNGSDRSIVLGALKGYRKQSLAKDQEPARAPDFNILFFKVITLRAKVGKDGKPRTYSVLESKASYVIVEASTRKKIHFQIACIVAARGYDLSEVTDIRYQKTEPFSFGSQKAIAMLQIKWGKGKTITSQSQQGWDQYPILATMDFEPREKYESIQAMLEEEFLNHRLNVSEFQSAVREMSAEAIRINAHNPSSWWRAGGEKDSRTPSAHSCRRFGINTYIGVYTNPSTKKVNWSDVCQLSRHQNVNMAKYVYRQDIGLPVTALDLIIEECYELVPESQLTEEALLNGEGDEEEMMNSGEVESMGIDIPGE